MTTDAERLSGDCHTMYAIEYYVHDGRKHSFPTASKSSNIFNIFEEIILGNAGIPNYENAPVNS